MCYKFLRNFPKRKEYRKHINFAKYYSISNYLFHEKLFYILFGMWYITIESSDGAQILIQKNSKKRNTLKKERNRRIGISFN